LDRHGDDLLLFVCIAAGALAGFSLTGSAAIGSIAGAAVGTALLAERHHHQRAAR
jgi:hypothetical protein